MIIIIIFLNEKIFMKPYTCVLRTCKVIMHEVIIVIVIFFLGGGGLNINVFNDAVKYQCS